MDLKICQDKHFRQKTFCYHHFDQRYRCVIGSHVITRVAEIITESGTKSYSCWVWNMPQHDDKSPFHSALYIRCGVSFKVCWVNKCYAIWKCSLFYSLWRECSSVNVRTWIFNDLVSLTHWGWDKMAAIFQTVFSNAVSWMNTYEFRLRFQWSVFVSVQLTTFQHWFR